MGKFIKKELTGMIFGRLTVESFNSIIKGSAYWNCICECGKTTVVRGSSLLYGDSLSCGCIAKERLIERSTTHGHHVGGSQGRTITYISWMDLRLRTSKPNRKDSHIYYGMYVDLRWLEDFSLFLLDMGARPSKEYTLDRIDGTKGYYKENCRWSTKKEQANNRKNNIIIIVNNSVIFTASEFCKMFNISIHKIYNRKRSGIEQFIIKNKDGRIFNIKFKESL